MPNGICFSRGLTSLSCLHVAADGMIAFAIMAEWRAIVYVNHIFFIHSSVQTFSLLPCLVYCG